MLLLLVTLKFSKPTLIVMIQECGCLGQPEQQILVEVENMKEVANLLEKFDVHWRFNKVYRTLHQEYMEIRNWILGRKNRGRIAVGRGRVVEKEIRDELLLMHGIRVAIIHEIFLLSVRVPKFSDQAGTSRDEIIAKLIRLMC